MDRLRVSKDCLAGLLFMGFGLLGLWLGRDLDIGSAAAMGSGYFPRMVSILLTGLGAILAVVGFFGEGEPPQGWDWRAFTFVILASIAFAALLDPLGLVLALGVTVLLANVAGRALGPLRALALAATLIVINVGVFVFGLGMPIALWPGLFR